MSSSMTTAQGLARDLCLSDGAWGEHPNAEADGNLLSFPGRDQPINRSIAEFQDDLLGAPEHWIISLLESPDGDLIRVLSPDPSFAEIALLAAPNEDH